MSWTDVHPDPSCMEGGLLWYGTWGGVHLHYFVDPEKKQEFRLCLTGGEANTIAISYDYKGKYWTPITFPNYMCKYWYNNLQTCGKPGRWELGNNLGCLGYTLYSMYTQSERK